MLRPRILPRIALSPRSFRRSIHRLPPLEQFEEGIPGLFTPDGFRVAWTEHQTLMIDKLNALTAGTLQIPWAVQLGFPSKNHLA
jgi:Fe-Mn family superoxide dismutase